MLTLKEFRTLCDGTTDEIARHIGDLGWIYRTLGLDTSRGMRSRDASDHLASEIRSHLPANLGPVRHHFRWMKQALIVSHVVDGNPLEPYFQIAAAIHDAARPNGARRGALESPDWKRVVVFGRQLADLIPAVYKLPQSTARQMYSRAYAVAEAASHLRGAGFGLDASDGSVRLTDAEEARIAESIEAEIGRLGGIEVARRLVAILARRYDPSMQRFHSTRRVDAMGLNVQPDVPVGYLLNLSAKHVRPDSPPADAQTVWDRMLALATDFAAVHDLQPHSLWELEYKDSHTLLGFLRELALYDSFFCLRQMRPRDIPPLIAGLFDWVPKELENAVGWGIADATALVDALIATVPIAEGGTIVELEQLMPYIAEASRSAAPAVFRAFCHDPKAVNREFRLPTSRPFPDILFRPLIGLQTGTGVVLNFPAAAPAFYEAVAAAYRAVDRKTDDQVGTAAERYLEAQLNAHGVTTLRGKYRQGGVDGECDFVIEADAVVILLEMKKKPLTRAAQAGGDLEIVVDVASSLFDAQSQLNGHELLLREHGSLVIERADGSRQELSLRGRHVEKVVVTLLDYGAFQDRTVLFPILAACVGRRFGALKTAVDPKKIDALNRVTGLLNQQFTKLQELEARYRRHAFFNCWFLSLPQLLIMLDRVNSNESFWVELKSTRHVTSHALDWYVDYANFGRR